jgi:hypothetical protein
MQWNPPNQQTVTRYSTSCASSGTWYTLALRHEYVGPYWTWESYVLTSDNCCYVWQSPWDPQNLQYTPEDGEFSSEVINPHDQSGGSNNYPSYLDAAYWWDSSYNARYTNWQGSERFCQLCGTEGPFNASYLDGNTVRLWTDGY